MKLHQFLIKFVLFASCIFAQGSFLNISIYDESEFYIIFNGTNYSEPGNFAEFDNLSPGEHKLKLTKYDASTSAQGSVIYDGIIKVPAGFDIYAVIDEYNSLLVYKKVKYMFNRCECISDTRKKCGDKTGEIKIETDNESTDECRFKAIKKDDFEDLKKSINNRNFESTNQSIVKEAIGKNYFTSRQLRELLSYFTFEDTKLEIAKFSYKKVCDKKNFFKVFDAFSFESSIEELKNYISGK